ncbi:hypothetical protein ACP275_03G052100 [Erythranthe tilingii]
MLSSKLKLLAKQGTLIRASYSSLIKNTHYYTSKPTHKRRNLRESALNHSDVSLSLASHVITAHGKDTNVVLSPLSINVLLGLVASGSNGPARNQILGYLKSKSIKEVNSVSSQILSHVFADGARLGGPRLSMANGVWIDQSLRLKPVFEEIVENSYKAAADHVDFQTKADEVREEVNAWAEKQTKGLIKDVLPRGSVDSLTRLIFANAVYFKGAWLDEFDKSVTKDRTFFLLDGSSIKVPFMTSSHRQYISEFDGFKVLMLPYKCGKDYKRRFSMYFFLPDAKDGLPDLLEKVGSGSRFIENHIPSELVDVGKFQIPKFKIDFQFDASGILQGLGVVLPFRQGGLTEMVDSVIDGKELYVSGIFQKAFIEVNEKGTEAAAATSLFGFGAGLQQMKMKKLDFVADHPFLFVIREDLSGVDLFMGQLLNPLA